MNTQPRQARLFIGPALDYRHNLPVLTVLVLLCKEAVRGFTSFP